jgi:hypothetical protein
MRQDAFDIAARAMGGSASVVSPMFVPMSERSSFLKKRTKKLLFYVWRKTARPPYATPDLIIKSFLFLFFSKKKYFLASLARGRRA